jgi:ubiquitin carboxyl-terminal hydrolase L3
MAAPRWIPLESNPEVLTSYSRSLGAKGGDWVDVYGFDDDVLSHILDVKALILLFPITPAYDAYCKEQDEKLGAQGDIPGLFYMRQSIHNACGTIGIIHSLANNTDCIELIDGTLKTFLTETKDMTPEERGARLEKSDKFAETHEEFASEGQTEAPNPDEQILTHFVAFVEKNGQLYELDGRRKCPISHGATTPDNFLRDAAKVCETRIKTLESDSTSEYRFSVVALSLNA